LGKTIISKIDSKLLFRQPTVMLGAIAHPSYQILLGSTPTTIISRLVAPTKKPFHLPRVFATNLFGWARVELILRASREPFGLSEWDASRYIHHGVMLHPRSEGQAYCIGAYQLQHFEWSEVCWEELVGRTIAGELEMLPVDEDLVSYLERVLASLVISILFLPALGIEQRLPAKMQGFPHLFRV